MNRKRKTILNFLITFLSQTIIILMGLIIPKIILSNYGSDTNGLTNTITQIFTYMALLEAGISASAKNLLYKPIKEDDKEGISIVLSTARRHFRKITYIYLISIIILSFLIPVLLKTNVNYWTIFVYTLFEGLTSAVSFYFIMTFNAFLSAKGETYIVNIIALIIKILCNVAKIILVYFGLNIAFIQISFFLVSLIQLLIYSIYMKRKYGWIDYKKTSNDVKLKDRNSYIITEIAWTIFSSTDLVVLSIFVSTSLASVYSIYNMVFISINSFLSAIYNSLTYNLGQAYVEDLDRYKKTHDMFNSFFFSTITILMSVTYILIIPFVKLYTDGVNDINYIYKQLPLLFCLVQLLSWSRYVSGSISGIAGYARQTSYISLAEAIINIVLSIVLVNFLGITGVLLATVIALPLKVIYLTWLSEIKIMKRKPYKTILLFLVNYLIFFITVFVMHFITLNITNYLSFFIYGICFTLSYSFIVYLINVLLNKDIIFVLKKIKKI